ncbi:uncharacterized protein LOC134262023 [Saccostrea cucullata]|uniref:uncharacterized protein LOC134262023 n=1 Tax=Saccostrea cuccullata TaxID=36930 RepID=UPI002ED5FA6B
MKTTQKSPEAGSSPPVKQLLDQPETVITIGTGYERLINVACLSDEEIWTSGNDSTMKLYSINQGSQLKSITTKSGHWSFDIVATKSGDLVYTDYNERTLNIVENEKIEVIRLQNWIPRGVYTCSTSSDDLLVIMDSDDDKQTKVVQNEPFSPRGITTDSQSHILTADINNDCVHIIDQDGQFLRYIDFGMSRPWGLCTDSNDNLLVAEFRNTQDLTND